jgi:hypothetical protein
VFADIGVGEHDERHRCQRTKAKARQCDHEGVANLEITFYNQLSFLFIHRQSYRPKRGGTKAGFKTGPAPILNL